MPRIFTGLKDQLGNGDVRFYCMTKGIFGSSYTLAHLSSRPRMPDLSRNSVAYRSLAKLNDNLRQVEKKSVHDIYQ